MHLLPKPKQSDCTIYCIAVLDPLEVNSGVRCGSFLQFSWLWARDLLMQTMILGDLDYAVCKNRTPSCPPSRFQTIPTLSGVAIAPDNEWNLIDGWGANVPVFSNSVSLSPWLHWIFVSLGVGNLGSWVESKFLMSLVLRLRSRNKMITLWIHVRMLILAAACLLALLKGEDFNFESKWF